MRRSSYILVLLIFAFATSSYAQVREEGKRTEVDSATGQSKTTTYVEIKKEEDITPRTKMIVVNPLKFILFYNLSYVHAINNTIAVGAGGQLPTLVGINGFGVNAEVRIHPSKKALRGFYIAPNVSYNHLTTDFNGEDAANTFSIGALLGWQWFIGDDFAIGMGIGYDHYFLSGNGSGFGDYDGGAPALRFDIGYAWD